MAPKELYPWSEWMDGHWHTARRVVEYICTPHSFRQRLDAKAKADGLRVGARQVDDAGTFAFRFLASGEHLFDRAPEQDGLRDVPRTAGGRPAGYQWSEWLLGNWNLAIADEDFSCSVTSFKAMLKGRAAQQGKYWAIAVVPGGPDSLYHRSSAAVIFRFFDRREDVTLVGADEALRDKRLSHGA